MNLPNLTWVQLYPGGRRVTNGKGPLWCFGAAFDAAGGATYALSMSRGFPILIAVVVLAGLVRAEDPPPPKVRRTYGERVNLQAAPSSQAQPPENQSKVRLPAPTIPGGGSDNLVDQLSPNAMPAMLPPPPSRPDEGKDKPWSMLDKDVEGKSSGWGWLADEVMKSGQPTTMPQQVQTEGADKHPWGLAQEAEEQQEQAAPEKVGQVDEESLVKSQMEALGKDAAGWKPVEARPEQNTMWSPAGTDSEPRNPRPDERNEDFSAPETPAMGASTLLDLPALPGGRDFGSSPLAVPGPNDRDELRRDRSLFTPSLSGTESSYTLPGLNPRSSTPESSLFTPASSPSGGGSSVPGYAAPSFGSMSAVDIPPALSVPAPVSPALELPSAAASTPSLGSMGSEMEARPKTLPW